MPDGGATAALISSLIGGGASLAGGLLAPTNQQLKSFSGTSVDPETMLAKYFSDNQAMQKSIQGQKFSLPDAHVQTPQGFSGGGLPFTIGLSGHDTGADSLPSSATPQWSPSAMPFNPPKQFSGAPPPGTPPDSNEAMHALQALGLGALGPKGPQFTQGR